ncbi:DUF4347 domain-containing protein, partial [Microcoleus sp. Pol8_C2]
MNVPTMNKQIIFVDSSVQDYQNLIEGADANAKIVILNDKRSGIEQITQALASESGIQAVHVVSHGNQGTLKLGADVLNGNDIENFNTQLKQWGNALTANGDILLYGCDVAAGETGKNFVKRLSELTGADVAASNNLTGSAALGGDWNLEYSTGKIESPLAFESTVLKDYQSTLPILVSETFTGSSVTGSWIWAVTGASNPPGLTAGPGSNTPLQNLNLDTAGNGALRLTSASTTQAGFVLYNTPITSTAGVKVTFDFFAYNGIAAFGSPGDGLSFFLVDGTANPTSAGSNGAGLGYTNLSGGYVGIGFDEFGSFSSTGRDSVAVRGSTGTANPLLQSVSVAGQGGIDAGSVANRNAALRRAQIILTPSNAAQPNRLSVAMDFNNNGSFADAGETIIAPFDITTSNGAVPTTFKFGFAGSTGAATNIHEIRNLIYETPTIAPILNDTVVVTLNSVLEDAVAPTSAVGTLISSIATIGTGPNNITDLDTGAVAGVAITAADTTNGSWFYTTNGGTNWNALGAVSNTNARLLAADANTRIYFRPSANYNGPVTNAITFRAWDQTAGANGGTGDTTTNGGSTAFSTATDTAAITVTPVNDIPSFTATNPASVNEDSGAQTLTTWATFNPGAANEVGQTATYTVSNIGTPSLFATLPAVNASGNLTYTPAPDAFGTSTFDVRVQDSGGTPGVDTSTTQTFTITVNPVNDKPSFSNLGNQTLTAWTNTIQTVSNWANTVIFGPANEATQTVSNYTVTNNDNTLFTTQPSVAANGTLTYTPSGKPGTATVNVQLQDNGGIANGGVDTSSPATSFNITIPVPKVNLTASTTTASEAGTTAITFTATAEGNVVGAQTIDLALTGTASAADFTGTIPAQITIADGSSTGQVTVTVNDDNFIEGTETATLTISKPSTGISLGTTTNQSVTITDNDTAGVTITPTTPLTTTEAGGTATFTVKLNTQPTADVTIPLTSSKTTEGTVDKSSLTFTSANWNTPQTVTVTGVDDSIADGNQAYQIITAADTTTTDTNYKNLKPADVAVTNTDIDTTAPTTPTITTSGSTKGTLAGTAEPNSTVNILQGTTALGTATADADGNWTFTPTTALADGTYAFTATAADAAGNVSEASTPVNLTIDATASSVPSITTAGTTSDTTPTLAGTAEPNSTVNILQGTTALGTATADADGNWTFTPTT